MVEDVQTNQAMSLEQVEQYYCGPLVLDEHIGVLKIALCDDFVALVCEDVLQQLDMRYVIIDDSDTCSNDGTVPRNVLPRNPPFSRAECIRVQSAVRRIARYCDQGGDQQS